MGIGYLTNSSIDRQLKSVTLSPKAITNAADAEAWFRAVPSGENVMKWHMTGEVFCPCVKATLVPRQYALCTGSFIPEMMST